jgi:hypothetical protein
MAQIDPRYKKQEIQIKSQIIFNLSHEHKSVTIKLRGDVANNPHEEFKKAMALSDKYHLIHTPYST